MDLKPLSYNGRNEGIEVTLRTQIRPGDDVVNVSAAIHSLFPDAVVEDFGNETFPSTRDVEIVCKHLSFETFLEQLRKQTILDTAMDAMGQQLQESKTVFQVSRLAAYAGKIAFTFDDVPLGGCFDIHLEGLVYPIGLKHALGIQDVKMFLDNCTIWQQWMLQVMQRLGISDSSLGDA